MSTNPYKTLAEIGDSYSAGKGGFVEGRPTLVMIHGAGGNAQVWKNQLLFLDNVMNVLALDLPGYGKTKGDGYSQISGYSRWLMDILKNVFHHPIFLMGHSMGGAIVQELAIAFPHILEGIILVGTGARLKVAPMFLEGLSKNFEGTVDTFISYAYAPKTDRSIIEEGARLMKAAGSTVVHRSFLACDRFDRRQETAQIRVPCQVLCGSEDKLTPPKLSEALHEGIVGSRLRLISNAGHMVMIERHKEFNEAVQEFISEIRS